MQTIEELQQMIEGGMGELRKRATEIEENIESRQVFLLDKIKEAKDNEILKALSAMERRLAAIEARLPEVEEEA